MSVVFVGIFNYQGIKLNNTLMCSITSKYDAQHQNICKTSSI